MRFWLAAVLTCMLCASSAGLEASRGGTVSRTASTAEKLFLRIPVADSELSAANPHSDLIYRATGATSCMDCHRPDKEGRPMSQVMDNARVRDLQAKAKGIHGPGRFADCLRCHAGGDKGVEKYRK